MKTYSTNISYLFNRQQWSFWSTRVSQCQDTVQQEGATTNQMQIKPYAESYDNNTYISLLYWIRIHINNIQLSFWNTKLCIQRRMKEVCDRKSMKKKVWHQSVMCCFLLFFHCGMSFFVVVFIHLFIFFVEIHHYVWVNLLCREKNSQIS